MDHLFADAAATSVGRMRTHLHVFVAEHAPDAQDLQALRSIRAYQKIVVHKGILVRRGPWRRSVRGKLAFFAECVHALFLDDCPISSFVRTSETRRRCAAQECRKIGVGWRLADLRPHAGETRFSPLKQIDASNVKRLGLVWSYEAGEGGGDQEATPLVWNNTIFGVTNWSIVFAIDARTG